MYEYEVYYSKKIKLVDKSPEQVYKNIVPDYL